MPRQKGKICILVSNLNRFWHELHSFFPSKYSFYCCCCHRFQSQFENLSILACFFPVHYRFVCMFCVALMLRLLQKINWKVSKIHLILCIWWLVLMTLITNSAFKIRDFIFFFLFHECAFVSRHTAFIHGLLLIKYIRLDGTSQSVSFTQMNKMNRMPFYWLFFSS